MPSISLCRPTLCVLLAVCGAVPSSGAAEPGPATTQEAHEPDSDSDLFKHSLQFRLAALKKAEASGVSDLKLAEHVSSLGYLFKCYHKFDQAEPYFKRALALAENAPAAPNQDSRVAVFLISLGENYEAQGLDDQAEASYRRGMAVEAKFPGWESFAPHGARIHLAEFYRLQGDNAQAKACIDPVLTAYPRLPVGRQQGFAFPLEHFAELYRAEGNLYQAEVLGRWSVEAWHGSRDSSTDWARANALLARIHADFGQPDWAEDAYKRSLKVWQRRWPQDDLDLATALENYAALLKSLHREADAEPLLSQATTLRAKVLQEKSDH